ncbi:MAG: 30S ribosomal protein S15 [Oligoflexus sp.]|nr:30S ribosomal protein S15 [Oligoflexus sp.]
MALNETQTSEIITKFGKKPGDSGSPEVQVALMTKRLQQLNEHFKTHTKDHHSRLGLLKLVGQRKRLLTYLKSKDTSAYKNLIGELGLRK